MDRYNLVLFAACVIASKMWSRMAISKPHSDACVVFDNFPKEAFYVAVVQPFWPRKARKGAHSYELIACLCCSCD
jgi:hypothetical protein